MFVIENRSITQERIIINHMHAPFITYSQDIVILYNCTFHILLPQHCITIYIVAYNNLLPEFCSRIQLQSCVITKTFVKVLWVTTVGILDFSKVHTILVPFMSTVSPWKRRSEGAEEIEESPGKDHVVVTIQEENYNRCWYSNT